ncbi:cellulose binding domain-containing protein [Fibrella sp. ES10-3-2-2]|nr:hypothetical protein A6C57_00195 [Fibrella sp. ES10-3-2-2]
MRIYTWLYARRLLLPVWSALFITLLTTSVVTKSWAQISAFTTAQIEGGTGCDWPFSSLAVNPVDGKVYGFWRKGSGLEAIYKLIRFDGSSWTTVSTFAPTGNTGSPINIPNFDSATDDVDLAIDASGRFHVTFRGSLGGGTTSVRGVWYGLSTTGTSWAFTDIQTFSDPSGFKGTNDPVIEVDANNQPHVAFITSDVNSPRTYGIRYYRFTGTNWVGETALSINGGVPANEVNNFDMAIDGAGKAHLAIQRETNNLGRNGGLVYMTNSSGSWATPIVVAEGAQDQTQGNTLGIDTDANNKVHIVFSNYLDQVNYTNNLSGSFSTSQPVNGISGDLIDGSFHINANGSKSFGYYSRGSQVGFAYQPGGTGTWTTALAYTAPAEASAGNYPSAILSNSGRVIILFDNLTTGSGACNAQNTRKLWYATATVQAPTQAAPTVTTEAVMSITTSSALLGGNVTANGGANVTERGVVYSTNNTPTIGGSGVTRMINGSGNGTFYSQTITSLTPNTTYYVRAYATNSVGTSYGNSLSFTTSMLVTTTPVLTAPANGGTTNPMPAFTGTAPAGSTVTIYLNGNAIATTTATQGGFSRTASSALTGGTYTVYATAQLSGQTVSANSNSSTFTVDAVAPTVSSIGRNNPTGASTNGTAVLFGVNFSEDVSGVAIGSFALITNGSVSGNIVGVQRVNNTSNSQYIVIVSDVSGNGTLRLDVKSSGSGISDGVGNPLSGGFTSGQTFTIDQTAPTVTISSPVGANGTATRLSPIPFSISVSESVSGFTADKVRVSNGTLSDFVGSGSGPYSFNVTPSANGLVSVSVAANQTLDAAGNGNTAGSPFSIDYQPLTITGLAGPTGACIGSPIPFTATISNASGPYAFTLAGGGSSVASTASGTFFSRTITASGAGPQAYTLTVQDESQRAVMMAAQPVTINALPVVSLTGLATAYCQDAAVFPLTGTPTGGSFTIDNTAATQFNPATLQAGNRTVGYTFTDDNGCTNSTTQLVTIKEVPPTPTLLTQSGGTYPASQSAVTVDLNTGNVNLVISGCTGTVNWRGPTNTSGMGNTISVPTSELGTFTYQATCSVNGCTSPAASATVTVRLRLQVLHRDVDNYADNNSVQPVLVVQNQGSGALPLSALTLRYYLTVENFMPLTNLFIYNAPMGAANVKLRYVPLEQPRQGALGYVEYSFTPAAGQLKANSTLGAIQSYFAKSDYGGLNELDDYSRASVRDQLLANPRITAYYNGVLVWGQEPPLVAPLRQLRVLTESKNGPSATAITTNLQVRNEGNLPVDFSQLRIRYYFTSDNQAGLTFFSDFRYQGQGSLNGQLVRINPPLANADTYLEITPNFGGQLMPLSSLGVIRYSIYSPQGARLNQTNDYSYQERPESLSPNSRVVVYLGSELVWGTPPGSGASARLGSAEDDATLEVTVLGNPVKSSHVQVQIKGAGAAPVRVQLVNAQGRVITQQQVTAPQAVELHDLSLAGQGPGVFLLQVSTPTQSRTVRVLKAE